MKFRTIKQVLESTQTLNKNRNFSSMNYSCIQDFMCLSTFVELWTKLVEGHFKIFELEKMKILLHNIMRKKNKHISHHRYKFDVCTNKTSFDKAKNFSVIKFSSHVRVHKNRSSWRLLVFPFLIVRKITKQPINLEFTDLQEFSK